jgi:hypothetical protein
MDSTEIPNSYVNLSEPVARKLMELARAQMGRDATAKQAVGELEVFLERFDPARLDRDAQVRALAAHRLGLSEGELEMDENAVVSEGDDNGAYVMTWSWVSFEGSDLDKQTA